MIGASATSPSAPPLPPSPVIWISTSLSKPDRNVRSPHVVGFDEHHRDHLDDRGIGHVAFSAAAAALPRDLDIHLAVQARSECPKPACCRLRRASSRPS